MNLSNIRNTVSNIASRAKVAAGATAAGASGLIASGSAFAFDATEVTANIAEYGATAVTIVGAFILAVWGVKAMGLLKRG